MASPAFYMSRVQRFGGVLSHSPVAGWPLVNPSAAEVSECFFSEVRGWVRGVWLEVKPQAFCETKCSALGMNGAKGWSRGERNKCRRPSAASYAGSPLDHPAVPRAWRRGALCCGQDQVISGFMAVQDAQKSRGLHGVVFGLGCTVFMTAHTKPLNSLARAIWTFCRIFIRPVSRRPFA